MMTAAERLAQMRRISVALDMSSPSPAAAKDDRKWRSWLRWVAFAANKPVEICALDDEAGVARVLRDLRRVTEE